MVRLARYKELRQILGDEIADGVHAVGGRFPTEYELCRRFGVSRHTVREALRALEDQGLLSRQAGAGTTVLARAPTTLYTQPTDSLAGLFDYAADTRFERQHDGFVVARAGFAEMLGCAADSRWLRLAGVRYPPGDDRPLCWTEIFAAEPYAAIREHAADGALPVYELIRRQFGIEPGEVEQHVRALAMPPEVARILGVEAGMPALMTRRRYFADGTEPYEISLSLYPADRYAYTQRLRRERPARPQARADAEDAAR